MANKTINQLTEDTSPANNDYVPTWDTSAGAAKKVTLLNARLASNPYKFFGYLNATANLTSSSQRVPFDAEAYDSNSNFDTTSTKGRYTAPVAGFYHFAAADYINILADQAQMAINIYKNGVNTASGINGASGANDCVARVDADIQLAASDYIEIYVSNSQGTRDHLGFVAGSRYLSYFYGRLISLT